MRPSGVGRILVVDDDLDIREVIAELLTDEGYEVSVARNGQEALASCRALPPELIILDLQMPVMDGLEFARVRDADPNLSRIPICVMTAFRATATVPPGVSGILAKPLGQTELIAIARRLCGKPPKGN